MSKTTKTVGLSVVLAYLTSVATQVDSLRSLVDNILASLPLMVTPVEFLLADAGRSAMIIALIVLALAALWQSRLDRVSNNARKKLSPGMQLFQDAIRSPWLPALLVILVLVISGTAWATNQNRWLSVVARVPPPGNPTQLLLEVKTEKEIRAVAFVCIQHDASANFGNKPAGSKPGINMSDNVAGGLGYEEKLLPSANPLMVNCSGASIVQGPAVRYNDARVSVLITFATPNQLGRTSVRRSFQLSASSTGYRWDQIKTIYGDSRVLRSMLKEFGQTRR